MFKKPSSRSNRSPGNSNQGDIFRHRFDSTHSPTGKNARSVHPQTDEIPVKTSFPRRIWQSLRSNSSKVNPHNSGGKRRTKKRTRKQRR